MIMVYVIDFLVIIVVKKLWEKKFKNGMKLDNKWDLLVLINDIF